MERFDNFEFNKNDVLGHGAFAIVYKGRYADKKEIPVAIKVIQKKHFPRAKAQSEDKKISLLEKEIKILKELANLKHENLVSLLRCHEVSNAVYLVMEYCNAGDLADYLNEKTTLPETTIQHFLRHMACAIEAIYKMGIVHRDLKPQNMLLCNPTGKSDPDPLDFIVKLADFGFARFLEDGVMAATLCGSPMYMAPEVLMSHKYCAKADLWSLGTIIFQCLSSKPPFHAATPNELRDLYEMNRNLEPKIPAGCNPLLRDLLFRLLKRDAKDRIEFEDFFNHPFLTAKITPSINLQPKMMGKSIPSRNNRHIILPSSPLPAQKASTFSNNPAFRSKPISIGHRPASPAESSGFVLLNKPEPFEIQRHTVLPSKRVAQNMSTGGHQPKPTTISKPYCIASSPLANHSPISSHRNVSDVTSRIDFSGCPVKQVQVLGGSRMLNAKAVPVPNQKFAYVEMEERRNASLIPKSSEKNLKNIDFPASSSATTIHLGTRNISVENISLPSTQFIVPEGRSNLPQRERRSNLCNIPRTSIDPAPPEAMQNAPSESVNEYKADFASSETADNVDPHIDTVVEGDKISAQSAKVTTIKPCADIRDITFAESAVDNLKFLSVSPPRSCTSLTVKAVSQPQPSCSDSVSEEEEEEEDMNLEEPIRLPFASCKLISCQDDSSHPLPNKIAFDRESSPMNNQNSSSVVMKENDPKLMENSSLKNDSVVDAQQIQVLAKLRFVLELVDMLINVAENKNNPMVTAIQSSKKKESDVYRRAEQLVIYVRALHMLSSALLLAQRQISDESLLPSSNVQYIINQLNEKYHSCLLRSQELVSLGLPGHDPAMAVISAERIMYKHAIELCQSAALDELFGKSHLCSQRYQTAYMMFHTLSEQVSSEADKLILSKYKNAVEKRLRILERQGHVQAIPSI